MIDVVRNIDINDKLDALYERYCKDYLIEYIKAFADSEPPHRINEFGIIDVERYDTDKGILFLAKETNGWSNEDYANGVLFREWLKGIIQNGLSGHVRKHPIMWYNIGRWASYLNDQAQSIATLANEKAEVISAIGTVAFTNMNKVRGMAQAQTEYWKLAYSDIAGSLLREELAILQPKVIVCCGTYYEFKHHIPYYEGNLIDMPHPGARTSTVEMLEQLASQLKGDTL